MSWITDSPTYSWIGHIQGSQFIDDVAEEDDDDDEEDLAPRKRRQQRRGLEFIDDTAAVASDEDEEEEDEEEGAGFTQSVVDVIDMTYNIWSYLLIGMSCGFISSQSFGADFIERGDVLPDEEEIRRPHHRSAIRDDAQEDVEGLERYIQQRYGRQVISYFMKTGWHSVPTIHFYRVVSYSRSFRLFSGACNWGIVFHATSGKRIYWTIIFSSVSGVRNVWWSRNHRGGATGFTSFC